MDQIDREILGVLTADARISFSELGRTIGLSTNATAARVRRLEADGVIVGYTVVTGDLALAPPRGLEVFIDLRLGADADREQFVEAVSGMEEIADAVHMTGPYDYLLRAFVKDTSALDGLLWTLKRRCGAAHTQTRIALRGQNSVPGTTRR